MASIKLKLFKHIEAERAALGNDPIMQLALDKLVPFSLYPFKLYEGETLEKLVSSISDKGILKPIVVRPIKDRDGYFEILSGHNCVNAVRLLGHVEIDAIIRDDLDDGFAECFFIESNRHHKSFADRTTYTTANDKIREIHRLHEILFRIALKSDDAPKIIDYSFLTRRINWPENATSFNLNKEGKRRETITSIRELRSVLAELVLSVRHLHYENTLQSIQPKDTGLAVNQLVLDILYNKYLCASEMTLNEYCAKHFYFDYQGKWVKLEDLEALSDDAAFSMKEAIYKKMKRNKESFVKEFIKPELKNPLKKYLSIDDYAGYIENNRKKTKAMWDFFWYQYNLPLVKSNVQASYGDSDEEQKRLLDDLISYDKFVQAVFGPNDGDNEDYFNKYMGFYHLESFAMIEALYRYVGKKDLEDIDAYPFDFMNEVWSLKDVSLPYINERESVHRLRFKKKNNFYRTPLSTSEYKLLDRAQAFELFTYYYDFEPNDYAEISEFIKQDCNILENYYEKNKFWIDIEAKQPLTKEQKNHIEKMRKQYNVIFGGIREMNVNVLNSIYNEDTQNKEDKENEDYENMFGMDKVAFEGTLSLLKKDTKKLRHKGGKKSQLSDLDQLLIAIECKRSHHSMEEIAKKYGVSKTTISEVNKRVSEILLKKEPE